MKYSITYAKNFRYLQDVYEIQLYWSTKDDIVDFVLEKFEQRQRIIIDFTQNTVVDLRKAMPKLLEMRKKHSNFAIKINIEEHKVFTSLLKEKKIPFFFSSFCNNWDSLYAYGMLGVSDVYITEELCFNLKDVKAFCEPLRIKIRVFPNIAQVSGKGTSDSIPDIKKFFIRPEDIEEYEPYVDICELWGNHKNLNPLYEIYKGGQWLGNISDIITAFEDEIPNTGIAPLFATMRINCKKKCYKGKCDICSSIAELGYLMAEEGYAYASKREELIGERDRLLKLSKYLKELKENGEKQKEAEPELGSNQE